MGGFNASMQTLLAWTEVADRLSRWLKAAPRTDEDCIAAFGIGHGTLERIRNGELEPDEALSARILRLVPAGLPAPLPTFALHKGPAGRALIMFLGEAAHHYTIDQARGISGELDELLALHDDPERFAR